MNKIYYVYLHIRKDNEIVFYVGKGTDDGNLLYERSKVTERNKWWKNITNKTDYLVEVVFISNSEIDAFNKEKELIKKYGRRDLGLGPLVNLTDGGEGSCGIIITEETRKKLSNARTGEKNHKYGKPTPKDTCEKISKTLKGRKLSEDVCLKMSESRTGEKHPMWGRNHKEESKLKMSEQKKGKMNGNNNPFFGKKHTEETSKKISESGIGRKWINNGIISITAKGDKLTEMLNNGWVFGRIKNIHT